VFAARRQISFRKILFGSSVVLSGDLRNPAGMKEYCPY
jgi:hypothetical protein